MTIHMDIGPEDDKNFKAEEPVSVHILNLKNIDENKKTSNDVIRPINLKDEIKSSQEQTPGRILIVGEGCKSESGLGRIPMIASALLLIIILNLGQVVFLGRSKGNEALAIAGEAFSSLKSASTSVISGEDGADAILLNDAQKLFTEAEKKGRFLLTHKSKWLTEPREVKSLRGLLDAGSLMTELGQNLSNAKEKINNLPKDGSLTDFLRDISETEIEPANEKLSKIDALLNDVDLSGTDYLSDFMKFREKINALQEVLDLWVSAKEPLLTMLGDRYPQRYLVLLMNNDEMRMGGGFIGSFLIVDINDGRIENVEFHDVYEFDNLFFDEIPVPSPELAGLTNFWRMRDSNIYADFPSSAKQAMWFLEQEGGPGVDGVIAVNLSAAQTILDATGPLKIPSLEKDLTAQTLPAVLSTLVEAKTYGDHSPKQILKEIIDGIIPRLGEKNIIAGLGLSLLEEVGKKQIMIFHKNPKVQSFLETMKLDGSIPKLSEVKGDFFMPIFVNIGANKTDRYMQTSIKHSSHFFDDGTIADSVTIIRKNTFGDDARNWLKSTLASYGFTDWNSSLEKILGDAPNHSGIRLYFPENSVILDTNGILRDEIQFFYDKANDISYYYVDQTVFQGETKSFTIVYGLTWTLGKDFDEYEFSMFKQPGLKSVNYEKTVNSDNALMLSSTPIANEKQEGTDYILRGPFTNDLNIKLLYR